MVFKDQESPIDNTNYLNSGYRNFSKMNNHMSVKTYTVADFMLFATFFAFGVFMTNFLRTKRDEKAQLDYLLKKFKGEKTDYEHALNKTNGYF